MRHLSWWGSKPAAPAPETQAPTQAPAPAQAPPVAEPASAPITEPTTNAAAASSSTPPSQFPNLDTITLDDVEVAANSETLSVIPEGIGYLKQIGLDYGTGPTSGIEWILEHMHIWGGLPWWGSIVATAVVLRLATFPFYLKSADQAARTSAMVSITKPISDRMTAAQKAGDQAGVMAAWTELKDVRARAGISLTAPLVPAFIQGVIGFCGFRLLKAAAALPVPGFKDGGFLWLSDLTISDGYLLMPALMAATVHVMVRYGGETGSQSSEIMSPGMRSFMLWGMPGMIFLITGWQSGAVCVWFATTGAFGMAQALLLQRPAVREFFGIAPLYKPSKSEGQARGIFGMAMDSLEAQQGKTINTTAKHKPSTPSSAPTYQSPNLRKKSSPAGPFKPPPGYAVKMPEAVEQPPKKGVVEALKEQYAGAMKKFAEGKERQAAKNKADAKKRASDEYERRASLRNGGPRR